MNQPVAGDGVEQYQFVVGVVVEMSFQSVVDQEVEQAELLIKTEEEAVAAAEVEVVLVAIGLVVPAVASRYLPAHSNRLRK